MTVINLLGNWLTKAENLNEVLNLFSEHFGLVWESVFEETAHFSPVNLWVSQIAVCNELALAFSDFLLSLGQVEG